MEASQQELERRPALREAPKQRFPKTAVIDRRDITRAPAVNLADAVRTYLGLTGGFDRPLHLSQFGLARNETERIFSAWDEDYQISRYLLLTRAADEDLASLPSNTRVYTVNGHESTHVTFRADIQRLISLK